MRIQDTPIYIPNRDNLERGFRRLVEWLLAAGMTRIVVIDNGSTYPPLLDWYSQLGARGLVSRDPRIKVHFAMRNLGPDAPWMARQYVRFPDPATRFIVSDPDVVPAAECPRDLVAKLHHMADYYGGAKVGPALRIDNLPDCYAKKPEVLAWEKQFWATLAQGQCYQAGVDTTFALYAPGSPRWPREPHYRLAPPYMVEHVPWYEDSAAANPERDFYHSRAGKWNYW